MIAIPHWLSKEDPLSRFRTLTVVCSLSLGLLLSACGGGGSSSPRYTLSGTVCLDGEGLAGIPVTLSGDADKSTLSDGSGAYSFTRLEEGVYNVAPSLAGEAFDPVSRTITLAGDSSGNDFHLAGRTISGKVTLNGVGYQGATVTLSGAAAVATSTDASGDYSFPGLLTGSYTVTPSLSGQAFTPLSRPVDLGAASSPGNDFALDTFAISGRVTRGGTGRAGVFVALTGDLSLYDVTDANGDYSFVGLPNGGYTVTPVLHSQGFSPADREVTVSGAGVTGQDFSIPSLVWFADRDSVAVTPDGLSWDTAFPHPQDAVDLALAGDQVWVAEGIYASLDTTDPALPVLALKDGVDLHGGFGGETTLDGGKVANHVVLGAGGLVFDGFSVVGGRAVTPGETWGAGLALVGKSGVRVEDCLFQGNDIPAGIGTVRNGAALFIDLCDAVEVRDCTFVSNLAGVDACGGGMGVNDSTGVSLVNCLFRENSAWEGGAISIGASGVSLENCTVAGNTTLSGDGAALATDSPTTMDNSIVWGNRTGEVKLYGAGTLTTSFSVVQGGYAGPGNIDRDPHFLAPLRGDFRLAAGSPCLDAGDNGSVTATQDLGGRPRVQEAVVDMGCCEGAVTPVPPVFATQIGGQGPGESNFPSDVALDGAGNLFVADRYNDRILKLDGSGRILAAWGSPGYAPSQFLFPTAIAIDGGGNLFVTDFSNNRVKKYDPAGNVLKVWGTGGTGDGQFSKPYGVAVDGSGNVYVADRENHRIQKFDPNGGFLAKWGTKGTGDGQLSYPTWVAVSGSGTVYVTDYGNNRVQRFDPAGGYLGQWGGAGTGDGQFNGPFGIETDGSGAVYVSDNLNHRVQKFGPGGSFLGKFGSFGSGAGGLNLPAGLAVDGTGNVYVADVYNHRVQAFDPLGNPGALLLAYPFMDDGVLNRPYGVAVDPAGGVLVADTFNSRVQRFGPGGEYLSRWGAPGAGAGQFNQPWRVQVDGSGSIYVADTDNNRIQKFGPDGSFQLAFGSFGTGEGQFDRPSGLAVDEAGDIYVADTYNHRIQKFDSAGAFLWQMGTFGQGEGQFDHPHDVAVDRVGGVYVVDTFNQRVQKLDADGNYLGQWGTRGYLDGQFYSPYGIEADPWGHVYVADGSNSRIQKFDSDGVFFLKWGTAREGENQLRTPFDVDIDGEGNVFVADPFRHRVKVFAPQ